MERRLGEIFESWRVVSDPAVEMLLLAVTLVLLPLRLSGSVSRTCQVRNRLGFFSLVGTRRSSTGRTEQNQDRTKPEQRWWTLNKKVELEHGER